MYNIFIIFNIISKGDLMTKIYIVRHCEAMGNLMRIFQGTTDLDISDTGKKQLELLEKRFSSTPIDKIYTSPLIRTKKTAEAIKGNRDIEIISHNGLIELDGGIVEGKPFKETFSSMPELFDSWINHPEDFHPENGESMKNAYTRIFKTIIDIAKNNKDKTIACATHGGVSRCLACRLMNGDIKGLKNTPWSENTAVSLIEFDDNLNPELVFYNDVSHLPEELMPKRNRLSNFMAGEDE